MSPLARKTAYVSLFIVGLVLMYGHGFKSGRNSQMTLEKALEIAKAQFVCRMEMK